VSSIAFIDSGTTTTRVRVVRGSVVVATASRSVGARDHASDGDDSRLRRALKEILAEVCAGHTDLRAAVYSGMITSNVGLLEVPHLVAPVAPVDLARGMKRHDFPDITHLPCYFVPGVRTPSANGDLAGLDVLRGEEVEVLGLRFRLGVTSDALFLHYGSHHKSIEVDITGRILGSRTSLTGELLEAVRERTVLKSSVVPLDEGAPIAEAWRQGLADAERHGIGRALFLVRVGEQVGGHGKAYMTSYLLGVLTALDLPLVWESTTSTVVLYGRGGLKGIMATWLRERGNRDVRVVADEVAAEAAAVGAMELLGLVPGGLERLG
jgi:2-dehydro-3-deoxygalactonokinase